MTLQRGISKRRRRTLACLALPLAVVWLATGAALAAPGDLDASFGSGGKTLIDFGGGDVGTAVALQPDGRIVIAGYSNANGTQDFALARLLNSQGTLDTSFGGPAGPGRSLANLGGADLGDAVVLQPDGRIVVAGYSTANGTQDFAVARLLNPQGSFDTSFGGGTGRSLPNLGGADVANAVALQPDGRIVVAGSSVGETADFAVVRLLNPQGTFDASFGGGTGKSLPNLGGADFGRALALQEDGRIVVAGSSNANGADDFAVVRLLNPQGTFDPSFGAGSGKSLTNFGGNTDFARAVALQPDGRIVIAGASNANGSYDFAVARLLPGGGIDDSFAGDGKSAVDFGGSDGGRAVVLQPDGKILVAGESAGNFVIARLQPNGLLDTTFGKAGKATVDFGVTDEGSAMVLQPDGKIIVAGHSGTGAINDFAVARLEGDPGGAVGGGVADTTRCAGRRATIVGTPEADRLVGTRGRDVIVSLGGKDAIRAGRGADIVCAGSSNDRVAGGPGNDRIYGQTGRDRLKGDSGNDRLSGGSGRDRLSGGRGRDRLRGGPGKDRLRGGPGKDRQRQ